MRAEAAKLLAAIVERLGPNRSLSGAKDVTERLLPAAAAFIQDGNLEARYVVCPEYFQKLVLRLLCISEHRN